MASVLGEVDDKDILDPHDLEQLYSWIDAAPLSRPKKHIGRDFSDGVSVAEIVHHYLPRMVELHNYVNANSTAQKKINWNMLNRKVFGKLSLKLSDKTLENVIEAKPGAIEQVLWDLRRKVMDMSPKSLSRSNTSSQLKGKPPSSGYSEVKLGRKIPSSTFTSSRIPAKPLQNGATRKSAPSPGPTYSAKVEKASDAVSYATGLKDELNQYGQNMSRNNGPTNKPETTSYQQGTVDNGNMDANANANNQDSSSLPPAHLIYKGHKMIPSMLLDIKNRQIRDLETVVNGLQKKVNFLDNLIQLKDNRVEDLTRQLHTLKSRFSELTQTKIQDLE